MRLLSLFAAILLGLDARFRASGRACQQHMPVRQEIQQSLAHDRHEGLNVSVDPYSDAERAKKKFGKAESAAGGNSAGGGISEE